MTVAPVKKQPVLKLGEGDFGLDIDNVEAASFGPEIGGKRTLVIASDNNFNPVGQFTQFVVFTLGDLNRAASSEGAFGPFPISVIAPVTAL